MFIATNGRPPAPSDLGVVGAARPGCASAEDGVGVEDEGGAGRRMREWSRNGKEWVGDAIGMCDTGGCNRWIHEAVATMG